MRRYVTTFQVVALTVALWHQATSCVAQEGASGSYPQTCIDVGSGGQKAITIIQSPVVLDTGDTWAVISWTTSAGGRSIIHAGTQKNNLNRMAHSLDADDQNRQDSYQEQEYRHLVRIGNLKSLTTYYFVADSGCGADTSKESRSNISQFTTKALVPEHAENAVAIVQGPAVETRGDTWAVIVWMTSTRASSIVQYGVDKSNLDKTIGSSYAKDHTIHRVRLSQLVPGATYYSVVDSAQDGDTRKEATSSIGEFTTLNVPN